VGQPCFWAVAASYGRYLAAFLQSGHQVSPFWSFYEVKIPRKGVLEVVRVGNFELNSEKGISSMKGFILYGDWMEMNDR
jgi:hypothetical protein